MTPLVELNDVSRSYGSTLAVDQVSLSIGSGTIHALLGPNGAGKTTLLRLMAGLVAPTSGRVAVMGGDPHSIAIRQGIGWVPAVDRSFYMRISGFENLVFFARQYGLGRRPSVARAKELLELVGLQHSADTVVSGYSHGMTRRLAIARALIMPSHLLLVDEATHDLDIEGSKVVRQLFRDRADAGVTVVWSTHRLGELQGFVDSVTVLDQGCVRFDGPLDEMLGLSDRPIYRIRFADPVDFRVSGSVAAALGTAATLVDTNHHEASIRLAPGSDLGTALRGLLASGFEILDCRQDGEIVERALESRLRES